MAPAPVRVLVAGEIDNERGAIVEALDGDRYDTRISETVDEAVSTIDAFEPEVVIVDADLPGVGGAMRVVRRATDRQLVLVLDGHTELSHAEALTAGADVCLVSPSTLEVVAQVEAMLRRAGRVVGRVHHVADSAVDLDDGAVRSADHRDHLTPTELEVLSLLLRHRGRVVSKEQLLAELWHGDAYDANRLEVHVSHIRHKLGPRAADLIETVRGVGYCLHG